MLSRERQRSIEFHIKNKDYFGTLAAVLDLLRQSLGESPNEKMVASYLNDYKEDLLFLRDNYEIDKL
jgi:hypothetical protein